MPRELPSTKLTPASTLAAAVRPSNRTGRAIPYMPTQFKGKVYSWVCAAMSGSLSWVIWHSKQKGGSAGSRRSSSDAGKGHGTTATPWPVENSFFIPGEHSSVENGLAKLYCYFITLSMHRFECARLQRFCHVQPSPRNRAVRLPWRRQEHFAQPCAA
ncbi:hypothetical protein D3C81_1270820 [compost metagenome]